MMNFSRLTLADVEPWAELVVVSFGRQSAEMGALWQWFHQGWFNQGWFHQGWNYFHFAADPVWLKNRFAGQVLYPRCDCNQRPISASICGSVISKALCSAANFCAASVNAWRAKKV
jgi:hypothetical protein